MSRRVEKYRKEAAGFCWKYCDELVQGLLPQHHGSSLGLVLEQSQARVMIVLRIEMMTILPLKVRYDMLGIKIEYLHFV